jgi:hypothetical protein
MATTGPPRADRWGPAPALPPTAASPARRPARRGTGPWLALLAAAAGCVVVGLSGPDGGTLPGCPFRAMTGLDCPGCGMTRGLRALVRGHPLAALGHNMLLAALVPLAAWWWLVSVGVPLPALPRVSTRTAWLLVGLVTVFAVVRNLPLAGCRWLGSS